MIEKDSRVRFYRQEYFDDVAAITRLAEERCEKVEGPGAARERAVIWEQAVMDLVRKAYGYWKIQRYCEVGWNVFNKALGSARENRRTWQASVYFTGPAGFEPAELDTLNAALTQVAMAMMAGATPDERYPARTNWIGTNHAKWEFPLKTGEVAAPDEIIQK